MSKRLVLSACAVMLLSASALARPGVATTTVNLRAEASTTSEVLGKMPAGARLDVGDCNDGWCAVTFQGKSGFAIATALDTSGRPRAVRRGPPRGPAGYDPDDDFEPVAPGYRPYPVAPPGVYGPGPYWGPGPYYYGGGPYWGPRWGYGWRRW